MSKIRQVYFYAVSLVGLLMLVFSSADLINLGLKTWVFPAAEEADYAIYPRPKYAPDGAESKETKEEIAARIQEEQEFSQKQRRAQKQRDALRDISFLIVGLPLFLFHFRIVQSEKNNQ